MIWVIIAVAVLMLVLGFELFLVLGVPVYLVKAAFYGAAPDEILVQKMVGGINHSILLAIPFFIFAGELMSDGRIARLLSRAAEAGFRNLRGGSGHAAVVSAMAFGSVSGSAPATVAALGRLMYPRLRGTGFSENFSLGLIVSVAETVSSR
jgi:C4-dicarboxylate transporter DctM subunit